MTNVSDTEAEKSPQSGKQSPLRFVTAASLFDGHDAAINVMRRLIQTHGTEVIHLGHNRSVADVVRAAIQEDADAIAVSSYQGGHNEYFRYMVDMLRQKNAGHIQVFGGGGGTITPEEIASLEEYGVQRIYHPSDGQRLGLTGMIGDLVNQAVDAQRVPDVTAKPEIDSPILTAGMLSAIEDGLLDDRQLSQLRKEWQVAAGTVPVVGITGTGGAGKSSVTDGLLSLLQQFSPDIRVAVLAVDPTRRRTGGALLGDRMRMNSLRSDNIFMRSIATRRRHRATSEMLGDAIAFMKSLGFQLVIIETAGIGQSDSEIVDLVDLSVYVMTSDYGAASQLEKIDMLDYADMIVLNKFEKSGADDALRDVRKQWRRNHVDFDAQAADIPVYPTIASQFNDPGITWLFANLCEQLAARAGNDADFWKLDLQITEKEPRATAMIPGARQRYLAEIAEQGRGINIEIEEICVVANRLQRFRGVLQDIADPLLPADLQPYPSDAISDNDTKFALLRSEYNTALDQLGPVARKLLTGWPERFRALQADQYSYTVRGKVIKGNNFQNSLSQNAIPKIAPPKFDGWGDLLRFLMKENLPGGYPYTAGVYPYRRKAEAGTRMFVGEGTPERTNRRFHYVAAGHHAVRLSTAFDSVTLYGEDPAERPDIYGKVGNAGVSIASVDDAKKLYSGFDLCAPTTSVSMTINGPAPAVMAFFMNTVIDQQVEKYLTESNGWDAANKRLDEYFADRPRPAYIGDRPELNDGLGLGLLGISGDKVVDPKIYERIKKDALSTVRGTVQADILKEDQAQNTCIFSTEFGMKAMGDVQQYFTDNNIRNFYSVSISGYHIAEAGANPISQLAFTLANGFTIVEYYLARGLQIDDFAPNLSFFFSNGMDPEYAVIGRVARRIWARAMREHYGANERSQMLKYHIQTSGRSLHAQEISFNDIRTTLQALYALIDNCNSLHTNAYDEAITTPTEGSVRRAVAIQMVINQELGLNICENAWQGSFIINELTDLVEEAVYTEFESISERGGVLGAMDNMYQRSKIQDESIYYESKKYDGSLPIIGVNTFLPEAGQEERVDHIELMRSTEEEKQQQIEALKHFKELHSAETEAALERLQKVARERGNVFAELMETVKVASLGQITAALYKVGGEYRRNM
ncbi:MAG: methylmalonyl-CoA mutase [Chromatiales bacterium]|nr:methylmalonyl-CoA mutase [Chromatiales bacterium]MDP7093452.1 methylmalonyl-CoA mutase family protein [Gammaproteobacteria bacterium]MDP7270424.1 methylmalonyl-CoA mutase family protein [Gammaproteobacteria bacterium]HJP05309.1 methylmalonyl-CoA mutase family protein [Gammaproteobacteria bacterium]